MLGRGRVARQSTRRSAFQNQHWLPRSHLHFHHWEPRPAQRQILPSEYDQTLDQGGAALLAQTHLGSLIHHLYASTSHSTHPRRRKVRDDRNPSNPTSARRSALRETSLR